MQHVVLIVNFELELTIIDIDVMAVLFWFLVSFAQNYTNRLRLSL